MSIPCQFCTLHRHTILTYSPLYPISFPQSFSGVGKEREVVIQGHLAAEVEAMLIDVCGIPKHLVESKLAKGVKPKKQHR